MQWGTSDNHTSLHPAKQEPQSCLCKLLLLTSKRMEAASQQLTPVQNKKTIPPKHLEQSNHLLIFSLGSIRVPLKEGYYCLEVFYASSFQTLLSHFPPAGSHFRFASWDLALGPIPAPDPSSFVRVSWLILWDTTVCPDAGGA